MPTDSDRLVIGTRGSALALWQARYVQQILQHGGQEIILREIQTTGDRILDVPLAKIGDKALFTKQLDVALLDGQIDLAVHSLKDLPSDLPKGLTIAAVPERGSPWDAFVAHPSFTGGLEDLPVGASVATSSLRRKAQLLAWRADLEIVPVRGNVDTRLEKLDAGAWEGMVLAEAGLVRLGCTERVRERIEPGLMLPAVSQGALGIVCRVDDETTVRLLQASLEDEESACITRCERAFLGRLEGGCQVPIGAHGHRDGKMLTLVGCVASLDGTLLVREDASGPHDEPENLGVRLAETLLERGAGDILQAVRRKA